MCDYKVRVNWTKAKEKPYHSLAMSGVLINVLLKPCEVNLNAFRNFLNHGGYTSTFSKSNFKY